MEGAFTCRLCQVRFMQGLDRGKDCEYNSISYISSVIVEVIKVPPKVKLTKEDILTAAVELVRQRGVDALNARSLAGKLGCSTQPVFSNYVSMEELKADVLRRAGELCQGYMRREMEKGEYPAYKASGMAYIGFAREEPELFKLLYMRQRTAEEARGDAGEVRQIVALIQKSTGLPYALAEKLHLEMWIFVHGIATMLVTSYLDWDWLFISRLLTEVYQSMKDKYLREVSG